MAVGGACVAWTHAVGFLFMVRADGFSTVLRLYTVAVSVLNQSISAETTRNTLSILTSFCPCIILACVVTFWFTFPPFFIDTTGLLIAVLNRHTFSILVDDKTWAAEASWFTEVGHTRHITVVIETGVLAVRHAAVVSLIFEALHSCWGLQ